MFDPQVLENLLTENDGSFFDDISERYPVSNLKPKQKPVQTIVVNSPQKSIIARLCNFTGKQPKNIKHGDKMAHVVLCELSDTGRVIQLKSGLGSDPVGMVSSITVGVLAAAKAAKLDAILFRFRVNRLQGREELVTRMISRLVQRNPKFVVFPEQIPTSKQIKCVLVHRRGADLSKIKGLSIDTSLFNIVSTDLGDRYVLKSTGEALTRNEAIAVSVAEHEGAVKAEETVAQKITVSKSEIVKNQSMANSEYVPYDHSLLPDETVVFDYKPEKTLSDVMDIEAVNRGVSRKFVGLAQEMTRADMDTETKHQLINVVAEEVEKMKTFDFDELADLAVKARKIIDNYMPDIHARAVEAAQRRFGVDPDPEQFSAMIRHEEGAIRAALIGGIMKSLYNSIAFVAGKEMGKIALGYTKKQYDAISNYADASYLDVNNYLTFREMEGDVVKEDEMPEEIEALDSAFQKGVKLPKGITLYRGMTFTNEMFEIVQKTKMFHFANYVSTSFAPIVYGGWGSNVAATVAGDEEALMSPDMIRAGRVQAAMIIKGADTIPTLPVGVCAWNHEECEIMLPRGTIVRIDRITNATMVGSTSPTYMLECTIINKDEGVTLTESTEKKPDSQELSFKSFLTEAKETLTKQEKAEGREIMASLIDLSTLPRKFMI